MSEGGNLILAQNGSEGVSAVTAFYDGTLWCDGLNVDLGNGVAEVAYPVPEVVADEDAQWPGPVTTLADEARRLAWEVACVAARGALPHATTSRPGVVRMSWSVRFGRGDGAGGVWQGYAIYGGGTSPAWQSIMVTGRALPPFGMLGRQELSAWLADPHRPADWYDAVRERTRLAAERTKRRAACSRGVHAGAYARGTSGAMVCPVCENTWPIGADPWRKPVDKANRREGL